MVPSQITLFGMITLSFARPRDLITPPAVILEGRVDLFPIVLTTLPREFSITIFHETMRPSSEAEKGNSKTSLVPSLFGEKYFNTVNPNARVHAAAKTAAAIVIFV